MKKIVFASYTGYPNESTGGPLKVIHQLITSIDKNNYELYFVSADYPESVKMKIAEGNSVSIGTRKKISSVMMRRSKIARRFFTSPFYMKYHFNIKENTWKSCNISGDILHSHDVRPLIHLHKNFKKNILTIHSKPFKKDFMDYFNTDSELKSWLKKFIEMENDALKIADKIIFPSYAAKEQFFNEIQNKEAEKKSIVIHNGIDVEKIRSVKPKENYPFIKDKNQKIFLTVSDHTKAKRIDLLIETIALLNQKGFNALLIIVGKGPLTSELKQLTHKLNIKKDIIFLPPQNNIEIISLMKMCDLYLMASERVIYDMVILEALAAGSTVIANNDGGNKEVIKNGINGYLLDMCNAENLADSILNLDFNRKLNFEETLNQISLSGMIRKYEQLYQELLS